jgi:TRAP transporter 4TM/12TM fusion protein
LANNLSKVRSLVSISLTLWCIVYISRLSEQLGIIIADTQNQAVFLGLLLTLTFLSHPAKKGTIGVKWYDWLLIGAGIVPNAYVFFFNDLWVLHSGLDPTLLEVIFFIAVSISLLEGLRRALGMTLSVILLFFLLYPLFCNYLPGILSGRGYSLVRITAQFYLPPTGMYYIPLHIAATIVIGFLVFGQFFIASGGGKTLMDTTLSMVGRLRGGAAKAAVFGSGLFGTFNGAVSANVATTGVFTIPMMKKTGYEPDFAAGVEAAASNGGMLLPPVMGAVAFIMAEWLEMPYWELCIMAFTPAILYYVCMFMQVHFHAARRGLYGINPSELPSFKNAVKNGWMHFIPLLILFYFLFGLKYSPELSAILATILIVLSGALRRATRLTRDKIMNVLEESGKMSIQIGLTCAMAGIIMGSVSLSGMAFLISGEIVRMAGGALFFVLLFSAIASFIMGLGMSAIPIYIFVSLLVAPALTKVGVPLVTAHLFVFWTAMGHYITPPVCVAAYVAGAIAGTSPMRAGLRATIVGIGIYIIPFVFVYNPELLLQGSLTKIIPIIIMSVVGIVAVAAAVEGYFLKQNCPWERALFFIMGIMVFVPVFWIRLIGIGLLIGLLLWQKHSEAKQPKQLITTGNS